jgi:hypothetical protein
MGDYKETEGFGTTFHRATKDHPKQPDMNTTFMHNGEVIKIAHWLKVDDNGEARLTAKGDKMYGVQVDTFEPKKKDPFDRAQDIADKTPQVADNSVPF